ncbi:inactive tyrosine-protein kinase 7-like [Saccoglossus kowalevskii]
MAMIMSVELGIPRLLLYVLLAYIGMVTMAAQVTPEDSISPVDRMVNKNDEVSFDCMIPGDPTSVVSWFHNNKGPISNRSGLTIFENGTLYIPEVKRKHEGEYRCYRDSLYAHTYAYINLYIELLPEFTILPVNVVAEEGDTAYLHCQADNSQSNPTIGWVRQDLIDVTNNLRYKVFNNGTLRISHVLLMDSGELTCIARHGPQHSVAKAYLIVEERLKFSFKPVPKPLKLGEIDTLVCKARGKTVPIVWWQKQGFPAGVWPDHINETDGTLTFSRVQKTDAGKYTCYAQNTQGLINETVDIQVVDYPTFTFEPIDTRVILGQPVMMHCQADGKPTPHISWVVEGKSLPPHFEVFQNGTLYTSEAQVTDEGQYTCIAGNSAGLNSREVTLSVLSGDDVILSASSASPSPLCGQLEDRIKELESLNSRLMDRVFLLENAECMCTGKQRGRTGRSRRHRGRRSVKLV